MGLHKAYLGRLTIPTGASAFSNILGAREMAMAKKLVFYNPASFTGTISLQVGPRDDTLAAGMLPLRVAGAAVTLTQGVAQEVDSGGYESIRVGTSGNEAAPRDIDVYAILDLSD